ncbi:unnamed protein product [Cuscuta campestris]|uniref:DUF4283 domain-containing protein n=1 Tax=Cuscuta campestris TaxID=132261 RepID=A0A484KSU5_9ASTE|nr:unnamed protein product [Cuscuta campestris]
MATTTARITDIKCYSSADPNFGLIFVKAIVKARYSIGESRVNLRFDPASVLSSEVQAFAFFSNKLAENLGLECAPLAAAMARSALHTRGPGLLLMAQIEVVHALRRQIPPPPPRAEFLDGGLILNAHETAARFPTTQRGGGGGAMAHSQPPRSQLEAELLDGGLILNAATLFPIGEEWESESEIDRSYASVVGNQDELKYIPAIESRGIARKLRRTSVQLRKMGHMQETCRKKGERANTVKRKLIWKPKETMGKRKNLKLLKIRTLAQKKRKRRGKTQNILRMVSLKLLAKQNWINEGDQSSRLFFAWIKKRSIHNQIIFITNENGKKVEGMGKVAEVMVSYFQRMLGNRSWIDPIQEEIIRKGPCLNIEQQLQLVDHVSPEMIKKALFYIPNSKSPGLDGYNSGFFKRNWNIVGDLVIKARITMTDSKEDDDKIFSYPSPQPLLGGETAAPPQPETPDGVIGFELSCTVAWRAALLKERFAGTISKASSQLRGCNHHQHGGPAADTRLEAVDQMMMRSRRRQIERERNAARAALEKVQKTVEFNDTIMTEFENLITMNCN